MQIDVLYFAGCPNHGAAVDLVREVVRDLGLQLPVQEIEVPNPEAAVRLGFLGSPTIRVNGWDVEPDAGNRTDYAMSCRVYGHSGVPPRVWIETALRSRAAP
ncbi:MAG: DF family (seleno)protein [Candidatus Eiseniibacteriota bacterium]